MSEELALPRPTRHSSLDRAMGRLEGKVAVITGAGSGLGRTMATRFAAEGAAVLAADLNEAAARATIATLGKEAAPVAASRRVDVTDEADCEAAVAEAVARWGRLDVTVANAGIGAPGFISDLDKVD